MCIHIMYKDEKKLSGKKSKKNGGDREFAREKKGQGGVLSVGKKRTVALSGEEGAA